MRHRARVDDNQKEIVKALRDAGASVAHTHMVGRGFPDIVVGHEGRNILIEIKDCKKNLSARKLTPDEQAWHDSWLGDVIIVESIEQALEVLR